MGRLETRARYIAKLKARALEPWPEKRCAMCGTVKPAAAFQRNRTDLSGLSTACRSCRKRVYATPEKNRADKLRRRYGLTLEAFDAMRTAQGDACAICRCSLSALPRIVVDHDHQANRVRGLLCDRCNARLRALDGWPHLSAAETYLRRADTHDLGTHSRRRERAFDALSTRQNRRCAICHRPSLRRGKGQSAVDHNHATGFIRGLLCWGCNLLLPALDDAGWREQAEHYRQAVN